MNPETKIAEVGGQRLTLERRVCDGGCRKDFWVLPSSPQTRARGRCETVCARGLATSVMDPSMDRVLDKRRRQREAVPPSLSERYREALMSVLGLMEKKRLGPTPACRALDVSYSLFLSALAKAKLVPGEEATVARYRAVIALLPGGGKGHKPRKAPLPPPKPPRPPRVKKERKPVSKPAPRAGQDQLSDAYRARLTRLLDAMETAVERGEQTSRNALMAQLGMKLSDVGNAINRAKALVHSRNEECIALMARYTTAMERLGKGSGGRFQHPSLRLAQLEEQSAQDEAAERAEQEDALEAWDEDAEDGADEQRDDDGDDGESAAESFQRRLPSMTHTELFDEVDVFATENDIDPDTACRHLGLPWAVYCEAKGVVEAEQARRRRLAEEEKARAEPSSPEAKKAVWKGAVSEAVKEALQQPAPAALPAAPRLSPLARALVDAEAALAELDDEQASRVLNALCALRGLPVTKA